MTERMVQVPASPVNTTELRRIEAQVYGSSVRTRESVQRLVAAGDAPPVGMAALVVHADRAALGLREAADEIDRLRALLSQPEPSECSICEGTGKWTEVVRDGFVPRAVLRECPVHGDKTPAEPPRIEDMAPGKPSCADPNVNRWYCERRTDGTCPLPKCVDPSTIRDVRPPA